MKQTKKFLRSKQFLRDMQSFRRGFLQGWNKHDLLGSGVWATNGRSAVLQAPITIEILEKMVKEMNAAMNQVREVFEFSMSLPLDWMLQRPIVPRSIIQGMDGV